MKKELKDGIGKYIHAKDGYGSEIWIFGLISYNTTAWGGEIEGQQVIFTIPGGDFSVNVSWGGDEWEGNLDIISIYDSPQELMNCLMERFKEEIRNKFGYNPNKTIGNQTVTHYSSVDINDQRLIGKFVSAEVDCYRAWFFDIQEVKKTKTGWKVTSMATLGSSSSDDVNISENTIEINNKELLQAIFYDSPESLLDDIERYIKEEIARTSGLTWTP